MAGENPFLSVVMPVYNERAFVEQAIQRVLSVDMGVEFELVVVDDGSSDGTAELLEELSPKLGFRLCRHQKNMGKGAALHTGFKAARGTYVIVQDADLEYDPADIKLLLRPVLEGKADVVYGSRFLPSGPHRVLYYWHYVVNKFLTTISNMLTNLNLTDMEVCYKLIRKDLLDKLDLREKRFGFEPEVTVKLARLRPKPRFYEVGISYSGRTYEEGKKIGFRDGVRALWCLLRYGLFG